MQRFLWLWMLPVSLLGQQIDVITIDGVINPAASEYILRSIEASEEAGVEALVIRLDTPGGLVSSMREIAQGVLGAQMPVIVYVWPPGGHAGSAGVFITMAAHVAAMAPGTNIGAASVVSMGGQPADSNRATLMRKATNDAVAFIRSLADQRNRNADWAERAVRQAVSITASQALDSNVVDYVTADIDSLMQMIDGDTLQTENGEVVLQSAGAALNFLEKPLTIKILDVISDPTIAYILFMLGIYGLMFELNNPGAIFPGIVGAICIILAFFALNSLPVNYAGVMLIILSLILFLLEIKIPSYGVLTIGGVIAFVLGSVFLYDSELPFFSIAWEVIAAITGITTLFFAFAIGMGVRAQRRKPATGKEYLIGRQGRTLDGFADGIGQVIIDGEIWQARCADEIASGDQIVVEQIDGLLLTVRKQQAGDSPG